MNLRKDHYHTSKCQSEAGLVVNSCLFRFGEVRPVKLIDFGATIAEALRVPDWSALFKPLSTLKKVRWKPKTSGHELIKTSYSRETYEVTSTNTFSNGCLGSHNDEERSEMRYVMRIAKLSESSKFWTQLALPYGKHVCWSVCSSPLHNFTVNVQRRLFAFKPLLVRGEYAQMKQQPELAPALQMSRRRDVNDCPFLRKETISRTRWPGCIATKSPGAVSVRTSNQSRIPAEFKHITKRRKRN